MTRQEKFGDDSHDPIQKLTAVLADRSLGRASTQDVQRAVRQVVEQAGSTEVLTVLAAYADGMRDAGDTGRAEAIESTISEVLHATDSGGSAD